MNTFFDQNGLLNIDEAVMERPSFRKIMDDGIVTDEELMAQSAVVTDLLHKAEKSFNEEQIALTKDLLAEMSVLYAVYYYKELQSLR